MLGSIAGQLYCVTKGAVKRLGGERLNSEALDEGTDRATRAEEMGARIEAVGELYMMAKCLLSQGTMAVIENVAKKEIAKEIREEVAEGAAAEAGSKGKLVNFVRVLQDDSLINPDLVDKRGMTNLERMQKGYAPIGPDGKPVNLHHVDQTMTGPVQEMTQTIHQQNYIELHQNTGQAASQIDRNAFGVWRSDYWATRSGDF